MISFPEKDVLTFRARGSKRSCYQTHEVLNRRVSLSPLELFSFRAVFLRVGSISSSSSSSCIPLSCFASRAVSRGDQGKKRNSPPAFFGRFSGKRGGKHLFFPPSPLPFPPAYLQLSPCILPKMKIVSGIEHDPPPLNLPRSPVSVPSLLRHS